MACQPVEMLLSPPSSLAATRTSVVISGTPAASLTMPAVGVALDVVDVGLVERPGVDLTLRPVVGVVDRAVVEAEDLGGSVDLAAGEPGVLGRLEGRVGGVGDEGVDGGLQRRGRRRWSRRRRRRPGRRRWWRRPARPRRRAPRWPRRRCRSSSDPSSGSSSSEQAATPRSEPARTTATSRRVESVGHVGSPVTRRWGVPEGLRVPYSAAHVG